MTSRKKDWFAIQQPRVHGISQDITTEESLKEQVGLRCRDTIDRPPIQRGGGVKRRILGGRLSSFGGERGTDKFVKDQIDCEGINGKRQIK